MARKREEIAADLVWRYVEHVRESPDADRLTDEDLEQLVPALKTAGIAGEALELRGSEGRQTAVRERLEALLASPVTAPRTEAPAAPPATVPAWRFRSACAAAMALAAALATVSFWHHPAPQVRVQTVTQIKVRELPDLDAMTEDTAHQLLPKMVHSRLSEKEEKSLMGHMLVCPGCYRAYVQMKHEHEKLTWDASPRLVSR
jgi:hypothetical protein